MTTGYLSSENSTDNHETFIWGDNFSSVLEGEEFAPELLGHEPDTLNPDPLWSGGRNEELVWATIHRSVKSLYARLKSRRSCANDYYYLTLPLYRYVPLWIILHTQISGARKPIVQMTNYFSDKRLLSISAQDPLNSLNRITAQPLVTCSRLGECNTNPRNPLGYLSLKSTTESSPKSGIIDLIEHPLTQRASTHHPYLPLAATSNTKSIHHD